MEDKAYQHLMAKGFTIGQETQTSNLGYSIALRRAVERGLPVHLTSSYTPSTNEYPTIWTDKVIYSKFTDYYQQYFVAYELDDAVIQIYHPGNARSSTDIHVWTDELKVAHAYLDQIKDQIKVSEKQRDENSIDLTFWMMSGNGPKQIRRKIEVPSWEEIKSNYTDSVATILDPMMCDFIPSHGGQLVLWHGDPGTGKTYALRALGREWRKWCDFNYIMDPERFFGHDADYLMTVLLDNRYISIEDEDEDDPDYLEGEDRWKLLIFEDTGELMSADAQERAGAGLSRFLNTVDGLIGQGLKVLLLVTTNQELGKLHPAVARAGRASVILEFHNLTPAESAVWAAERGITVENRAHPLSDLYAALSGARREPERPLVGFARR